MECAKCGKWIEEKWTATDADARIRDLTEAVRVLGDQVWELMEPIDPSDSHARGTLSTGAVSPDVQRNPIALAAVRGVKP